MASAPRRPREVRLIAFVTPRTKLLFTNVNAARFAVQRDSLACVYRRAGSVFVVTAYGTGTFTPAEWDASAPR